MKKLLAISALLATAALLVAADTKVDYSHSADFARYHTYSWIKVKASDSLWENRITRDVDAQLAAKGWMRVPSGGEAAVSAFGSTQEEPTLNTFYDGLGGGWGWGGFGESTTTETNQAVGTLTIDIFDAQNKKLIWRGTISNALSGSAEKNDKKLEKNVDDLFRHFPPQGRG